MTIDPDVLKACKESISELIEDADKNVSLPLLSHNFGIDFKTCSEIIETWHKENEKKIERKIEKNYFVQYKDEAGKIHISVINEEKLNSLKKKYKELVEMLYGISLVTSNRPLGITERYENVHKSIRIESNERKFHYQPKLGPIPDAKPKAAKPTLAGTKAINNMFSGQSSKPKPSTSKAEDSASAATIDLVKSESESKSPPPSVPTKQSPKKKETPVKKTAAASKAPVPKNSIASFFAKGAAKVAAKPSTAAPVVVPTIEIKDESPPTSVAATASNVDSKKRPATSDDDDCVPGTPIENTKSKNKRTTAKKFKPAKKATSSKAASRIMQIVDSSDEDNDDEDDKMEVEEKKIEYEDDDHDVVKVNEPEQKPLFPSTSKPKEAESRVGARKIKGRRQVDRTYMDDDGFVVTVKETEEYSLSEEDEPEPPKKEKIEERTKSKSAKPAAKTKQGSLLSFFQKK